ncbi:hypothetical protein C9J85_07725 [Haloferax sp. wsp5]|nr:hypothetical protein C9J85_07725 [Haloferax sp. wsp5]
MHTNALATAMTLYRSGALTLSQAAARSGYSEDDLLLVPPQHGGDLVDGTPDAAGPENRHGHAGGDDDVR